MNANIHCNGPGLSRQHSAISIQPEVFHRKDRRGRKGEETNREQSKASRISFTIFAAFPVTQRMAACPDPGGRQHKSKDQIIPDSFATFAPFAVNLFG
ncbi:MAG TPA: hypothetical protein VGK01_22485 [Candidatus Angelobacter sp.]|jgi:hypothetical protein